MTIALPTNNKTEICKRTGQAKYFAFYSLKDEKLELLDYKINPQQHEQHNHGDHEHHHSHAAIMQLLESVDVLLIRNIGKYMKLDLKNLGIKYIKIKETTIEEAIQRYINS